ncbi:MAG: ABC transporter ATP-binding protein, partial [Anaerolineae bacterium]
EREFLRNLGIRLPREVNRAPRDAQPTHPTREAHWSICIDDVSFGYHRRQPVLEGVSLTIKKGEFVALTGDNGSGKSTLARLILGLLRPDRGTVWVRPGNGRLIMGREVGLLLQNPVEQLFCDTVDEEIAFGLENYRVPGGEGIEQALAVTDLSHKRSYRVQDLSSGEHQRLALASVLALAPEALILDEPTLGQDWGHLSRLMAYVGELNRQGTTVVLITHDAEVVQTYAQRTVRLAGGRLVGDATFLN